MTSYQFNSYILPLVEEISVPSPSRVGSASTPARPGEYAAKRYLAARNVKIGGTLIGTSYTDLQEKWSTFCAAHNTSLPTALYAGRDDYFLYAIAESISDSERGIGHIAWEVEYKCHDPHWYSVSENNISVSSPASFSVSVNGNASSVPRFTLNISAAPAASTITLTNSTTGEAFTVSPVTTGQIIVDSRLETVTNAAGDDKMSLFSGRFVSLKGGTSALLRSNSLVLSTTGGASVSSLGISFRDRCV